MKRVRVSKSYAVLLGLEAYGKLTSKTKHAKAVLHGEKDDTEGNKIHKPVMPLRKESTDTERQETSKFERKEGEGRPGTTGTASERGSLKPSESGHRRKGSLAGRIKDFFAPGHARKESESKGKGVYKEGGEEPKGSLELAASKVEGTQPAAQA